jgi:hypothetical protein
MTRDYCAYRQEVDAFLKTHLAGVCTQKCYQSRVSACCSKEGIITFETLFIKSGYSSALMYMHNSPGLLRVKQRSALGYSETIQKDR